MSLQPQHFEFSEEAACISVSDRTCQSGGPNPANGEMSRASRRQWQPARLTCLGYLSHLSHLSPCTLCLLLPEEVKHKRHP